LSCGKQSDLRLIVEAKAVTSVVVGLGKTAEEREGTVRDSSTVAMWRIVLSARD